MVQVAGNVFIRLVDVGIVLLLTRHLAVEEFGRFTFLITYFSFWGFLADAGAYAILVRDKAGGEPDRGAANSAWSLGLLATFMALVSSNAILLVLGYGDIWHLSALASLSVVFSPRIASLRRLLQFPFHATMRLGVVVLWSVASYVLLIGLLLVVARTGGTLAAVLLAFAAAEGLSCVGLVFSHLRRFGQPRLGFDLSAWRRLLTRSVPLMLSGLLAVICSKLGLLLLAPLAGETAAALYGMATKLPDGLPFIAATFVASLYPLWALYSVDRPDDLRRAYARGARYLMIVVVPIAGYCTIYPTEILLLLFTPALGEGTIVHDLLGRTACAFSFLVWTQVLVFAGIAFSQIQVALGRERAQLICIAVSAATSVLLNLALIPRLGIVGAGVATLVSTGGFLLAGLAFAPLRGFVLITLAACVKPILATCSFSALLMITDLGFVSGFVVAALTYAAVAGLLGAIDRQDLRLLKQLLPPPV